MTIGGKSVIMRRNGWRKKSEDYIEYYSHSFDKSFHSGFMLFIKTSFLFRENPFMLFSLMNGIFYIAYYFIIYKTINVISFGKTIVDSHAMFI